MNEKSSNKAVTFFSMVSALLGPDVLKDLIENREKDPLDKIMEISENEKDTE